MFYSPQTMDSPLTQIQRSRYAETGDTQAAAPDGKLNRIRFYSVKELEKGREQLKILEPPEGLEPPTRSLQNCRSTN
jgi:hypothetical protein